MLSIKTRGYKSFPLEVYIEVGGPTAKMQMEPPSGAG